MEATKKSAEVIENNVDTKVRILNAAERLFADHGFAATSLRAITAEAGVNLGAVNYHFGSKDELIEAVFVRRLEPINAERLARLDELEEKGGERGAELDQVVEAFIGPALRMSRTSGQAATVVRRLLGHAISQPKEKIRRTFTAQFGEVVERFTVALKRALPERSEEEVFWRLLFMVGAMAHTMALSDQLPEVSRGLCHVEDVDDVIRRLVGFISAGMRAPSPPVPAGAGGGA
jgi:AcrR family transcriptional regulator